MRKTFTPTYDNDYVQKWYLDEELGTLMSSLSDSNGGNQNGNYIQFPNGIMICYGNVTTSTLTWTLDNGTWYNRGQEFPDFPKAFISPPVVLKTIQHINKPDVRNIYITGAGAPTKKNPGTYNLATYWQATDTTVTASYIAIGRWK